jgi:hypothetical protein
MVLIGVECSAQWQIVTFDEFLHCSFFPKEILLADQERPVIFWVFNNLCL